MIRAGEALLGETMLRAQEMNVTPLGDVLIWSVPVVGILLLILIMRAPR